MTPPKKPLVYKRLYVSYTIGRTYVSTQDINKHAHPISITEIVGGLIFNDPVFAYASSSIFVV
jgi:hypothetical protein